LLKYKRKISKFRGVKLLPATPFRRPCAHDRLIHVVGFSSLFSGRLDLFILPTTCLYQWTKAKAKLPLTASRSIYSHASTFCITCYS